MLTRWCCAQMCNVPHRQKPSHLAEREAAARLCGRSSVDQWPRQRGSLDPLLPIGPAIHHLDLTFAAITTQPQAPGVFLGRSREPVRNGGVLACTRSLRDPCSACRHAWAGIGRVVLPALQTATAAVGVLTPNNLPLILAHHLGDDSSPSPVPCLPTTDCACHSTSLPGAARALAADTAAAANGGAAHPGCPPDVEAALDSAMPDVYGGPDELIFWASNQSCAGVSANSRMQRFQHSCLAARLPTVFPLAPLAPPSHTLQGMVRGYTKLFAGDGNCFGPAAVGVEISTAVLEGVPGPEGASMQPPPECKT